MKFMTLSICLMLLAAPSFGQFSSTTANSLINSVNNPLNNQANQQTIQDLVEYVKNTYPTCKPNICFALDGSGSINNAEFDQQKGFVLLLTGVLGGLTQGDFAANQYGVLVDEISPLTSDLLPPSGFMGKVVAETSQGSSFTFVGPGLQYCMSEFDRSPQALNKLILLGDGRSNFGDNFPFGAPFLAKEFLKKPNNKICAGLVGNGNFNFFKELVGGDESLVFREDKWPDMINVIRDFVDQICG